MRLYRLIPIFVSITVLAGAAWGSAPPDELIITKTAVESSGSCPGVDVLAITETTDVRYCYQIGNPLSNSMTYTRHNIFDDVLGEIVFSNGTSLSPGSEASFEQVASGIDASVTNMATWGAWDGSMTTTATDTAMVISDIDMDGLPAELDPKPDAVDPTGCFYDLVTGEIIPGGSVSPAGGTIVGLDDGSDGCYQFDVTGLPATVNLNPVAPPGYVIATCPITPTLDPTGFAAPCTQVGLACVLGALQQPPPNDDFLQSAGCQPYTFQFDLESGDPEVLANNIALINVMVPAPALHGLAYPLAGLVLTLSGLVAIRRRRS